MSTSLLDWILNLLRDPDARASFQGDPDRYAADHGFHDLTPADVHDALHLIADSDSASYDHRFSGADVHYPPPPDYEHVAVHHGGHAAAHYLNSYISNNYKVVDQHNTYLDNSVHQDVDTHGGDFHQTIDNDPVVASGDHSVAAGGDIDDSRVTTGDDNVVGDHNHAVTGDHNTTAFGSGDAGHDDLRGSHFGDGGALSIGGDAHGHSEDDDTRTSVHSHGSGDTAVNTAGAHADASQYADQHESDSSTHSHYTDDSHTDSHDDYGSHNHYQHDDSHQVDVHH